MQTKNVNRPLNVFLCHSNEDKKLVRELYQKLTAESFDVWLDEEKLIPGQDWQYEIERAIDAADVVLICLSNNSINKTGYIQKEIKIAIDYSERLPQGTIFIIPTRLENCDVPKLLSKWQWVDFFEEQGYNKLKNALFQCANRLGVSLYSEESEVDSIDKIFVRAFGEIEIKINDRVVGLSDWQTENVRDLFLFFYFNKTKLSKEDIASSVWKDLSDPLKIRLRLKNDFYRLRRAVGSDVLIFYNQLYYFNREINHSSDVELFENRLAQASKESDVLLKANLIKSAIDLVQGIFLEGNNAVWAQKERTRLLQEYSNALCLYADCCLETGYPEKALDACLKSIEIEPSREEAYRLGMSAYSVLGRQSELVELYNKLLLILEREDSKTPSVETEKVYRNLLFKN